VRERRPEFRVLPLRRRDNLAPARRYVRFYGRYRTANGQLRGFEFKVKVTRLWHGTDNRRRLHELIANVCSKMKYDKQMPVHVKGEAFPTFEVLLEGTDWVSIRKLVDYDLCVPS
jgi:hypothetical protein